MRLQVTVSGAATSLLLMDEVDGALDETNQQHVRCAAPSHVTSPWCMQHDKTARTAPMRRVLPVPLRWLRGVCVQVARLLSGTGGGCSQVLSVSHNAAFQQLCQHVVRCG